MNIKVTLKHNPTGQERAIYAGLFKEFVNSGIMTHNAYEKIVTSGECSILIEGITQEEKVLLMEKMRFELSLKEDGQFRQWKSKP